MSHVSGDTVVIYTPSNSDHVPADIAASTEVLEDCALDILSGRGEAKRLNGRAISIAEIKDILRH